MNIQTPPGANEVRELRFDQFSSSESLTNAAHQALKRKYQDFLIVDVDVHHYESESYAEVFKYIESPVIRRAALESMGRGGRSSLLNSQVGRSASSARLRLTNVVASLSQWNM